MANHFCHLCGGLVDLIKLQPQGVRLCDCADAIHKLKTRIKELKEQVQSRDNAICALIDDDTKDNRISELEEWNAAYTSRETAYTNRISELEATMDAVLKLIAGAPHEQGCASLSWDLYKRGQCTCWKSKIGSK